MRKVNTTVFLSLCSAVLCLFFLRPTTVQAASDQARYCQGCQTNISSEQWTAIGGNLTETLTMETGKHYYLTDHVTGAPESGVLLSGTGCLDLNGYNITAGESCMAISCGAGTLNIMGTGTVTGAYVNTTLGGAAIHAADTSNVHLYGGTYTKNSTHPVVYIGENSAVHMYEGVNITATGTYASYAAVYTNKATGLFHMHGGTITGGTLTDSTGGSLRIVYGRFIMDAGTITGGHAIRGGNVSISSGANFTMNGGTITSGTATATYGGGNIYITESEVTMNDGLITKGTATGEAYGGGNLGMVTATFNMYGGTISYGTVKDSSAIRGGGNIYMGNEASVLNVVSGRIEYGWLESGSGINAYINNGTATLSPGAYFGYKGTDTGGSMNFYMKQGNFNSAATFTAGINIQQGTANITGGQYYSVKFGSKCTAQITGGNFQNKYTDYVAEGYKIVTVTVYNSSAYKYCVIPNDGTTAAVLVGHDGTETKAYAVLSLFDPAKHSHIKLYDDFYLGSTSSSKTPVVDLNGHDLWVDGTGTVQAFDSANDTYDATACGTITNKKTAKVAAEFVAPNGNRYVAVTEGRYTTLHRLDMKLTTVSLRPAVAGIYYKTTYYCDDILASNVDTYGVAMSLLDMPGSDFMTEEKGGNLYTQSKKAFQSGISANSAIVTGILKDSRDPATNSAYGNLTIYANPYIKLKSTGVICMGDFQNPEKEKSDNDFTGKAYSLYDVMMAFDAKYPTADANTQSILRDFYTTWKNKGMDWPFVNIVENTTPEPEPEPEPTEPEPTEPEPTEPEPEPEPEPEQVPPEECPVCKKLVTWIPLDQETYAATPVGNATNGQHYYLAEDITYTGTSGSGFIIAPTTAGHSACFHLNGHNLTATASKAVYGHSGILNVMGEGEVAGYVNSKNYGAAVQINNSNGTGVINLYGGTYSHAEGSHSNSYVVAIWTNGGNINIYDGVVIDGSANNCAIRNNCTGKNTSIGLSGTTVTGNVYISGASSMTSKLTLDNTSIDGTLDIVGRNTVTLGGKQVINRLNVATTTVLKLEDLAEESDITVSATGRFTEETAQAAAYLPYFHNAKSTDTLLIEQNALVCRATINGNIAPNSSKQASCKVCSKTVTWTALTDASAPIQLSDDTHYYLTGSLTYEGDTPFITAGANNCLHLNGYNITATKSVAIYSNSGTLNILGNGTVTGYAATAMQGAAVSVDGSTGTISLYGGTYKKLSGSNPAAGAVGCTNAGGTLKLNAEVCIVAEGDQAITVGTSQDANTVLSLKDADIQGSVSLPSPAGTYTTTVTVDSVAISGKVDVASGVALTLAGRPRIKNLAPQKDVLVTLGTMTNGAAVRVSAEGAFSNTTTNVWKWANLFGGAESGKTVVVKENTLHCVDKSSMPSGTKILVIGNSQTYYSKYVLDKGHVLPLATRRDDQGYLYQVFRANGADVSVTNFTFGNHTLYDFYSGKCKADRGHNGHNHLEDLMVDRNYDYVIFQEGNEAAAKTNILAECKPLMDFFLEGNPDTKFAFLVPEKAHRKDTQWISSVKELEEAGVIVVDWGAIATDLINGTVTAPGGTEIYQKFSFIVNKSATDGHHPNILGGYLAAQMTYCAITGESAVGNDYSFWNNTNASSSFKLSSYMSTFYAYDATEPSNTNFETIFNTPAEMNGLHLLIDKYLEEKSYRNY